VLRTLLLSGLLMISGITAGHASDTSAADEKRARSLLAKAVAHYQANGDLALAAFSRQGEFIDGELYVVVLSDDGVMLASGGSSATLMDRNIADLKDAAGKTFVREKLALAKPGVQERVEYRWLNRKDRKVERKVAFIERVGDKIVSVGFYEPHGTSEQAQAMLERAVEAMKADAKQALTAFNDPKGAFIEDDLYVFVIDMDSGVFRAHGAYSRLVGTQARTLRDAQGAEFVPGMLDKLKRADRADVHYAWKNSVTGKVLKKHTYLGKVGANLIGVGYYQN